MTWGIFADTIYSVGLLGQNQSKAKIIALLFSAAGTMAECNTTATQKWINGSRNCKSTKYFPDAKLNNPDGVYQFFRNHSLDKIQELQKKFREIGGADSSIIVDTKTHDMDEFCWSLVNQFLEILGFPLLSVPSNNNFNISEDITPADISTSVGICETESNEVTTNSKEQQVRKLFLDAVREYKIMEIISRKPAILNRYDYANFYAFDDQIRSLVPGKSPPDSLERLIEAFSDCLLRRALSLEARLNNQFGCNDDVASVNMEENDVDSGEYIQKLKRFGVPELTGLLKKTKGTGGTKDLLGLLKIAGNNEWENFKFYMNFLYEKISCWDVVSKD